MLFVSKGLPDASVIAFCEMYPHSAETPFAVMRNASPHTTLAGSRPAPAPNDGSSCHPKGRPLPVASHPPSKERLRQLSIFARSPHQKSLSE